MNGNTFVRKLLIERNETDVMLVLRIFGRSANFQLGQILRKCANEESLIFWFQLNWNFSLVTSLHSDVMVYFRYSCQKIYVRVNKELTFILEVINATIMSNVLYELNLPFLSYVRSSSSLNILTFLTNSQFDPTILFIKIEKYWLSYSLKIILRLSAQIVMNLAPNCICIFHLGY